MNILLNYANSRYKYAQKMNSKTALKRGGFDKVYSFGPKDIDEQFREKNKDILSHQRGNGYWLWKPYFILRILHTLGNNDYLFYADSGTRFYKSITPLIERMESWQQAILFSSAGGNPRLTAIVEHQKNRYRTKRDTFILMGLDTPKYTDSRQHMAGYILLKKTPFAIQVIEEWLRYAQDPRVITDMPNQMGKMNYEGWMFHRYDQSILSLLMEKYNIRSSPDLANELITTEVNWLTYFKNPTYYGVYLDENLKPKSRRFAPVSDKPYEHIVLNARGHFLMSPSTVFILLILVKLRLNILMPFLRKIRHFLR